MRIRQPKKLHGFTIWQGPSELDGSPIVLIAVRTEGKGVNRKTGAMVQTYILRTDTSPIDAIRNGLDYAICGNCKHRHVEGMGSCYVNVAQGPTVVYKAFHRGNYPLITLEESQAQLEGELVRMGTYGDPAAIPSNVWPVALAKAKGRTGYTHQWKTAPTLKALCMASCDTEEEYVEARAQGWRAFFVVPKNHFGKVEGAFLCPASEEGGRKLTCNECLACDGTASKRTASVYIPVHGVTFKQTRFNELIQIGRN